MRTYKREPCPKCGNRTFATKLREKEDKSAFLMVPACLACHWEDEPRES